jgi:hypothetical protein
VSNWKKLRQDIPIKLCGKAKENFYLDGFIVQRSQLNGHMSQLWHGLEARYNTLNKRFHLNKLSNRRLAHTLQIKSNVRKRHIHIGIFVVQYLSSIFIGRITQINEEWKTGTRIQSLLVRFWHPHHGFHSFNNRGNSS